MSDAVICFITPGHLASNPRLVKEASAAADAGYRVRVVFSQYMEELAPADLGIVAANPSWDARFIDWRRTGGVASARRAWSGARQRAAARLFEMTGSSAFGVRAVARVYDELLRLASRDRADLYVAHNLDVLPVAAAAARHTGSRFAFDAEDFHRGQLDRATSSARRLVEWTESRFLPECAYVTASSDGIAEAYVDAVGIRRPTTVLNVFPLAERDAAVPVERLESERSGAARSIYWFSQTIGPGRGLEDAVDALSRLDDSVHLTVRGMWAAGYERELMSRARTLGIDQRIHHQPTVPPSWMVPLAMRHDVGLAIEPPRCINADICASNKMFTYLVAGIPVVASATEGQRHVGASAGAAVRFYDPGAADQLADAILAALDDPRGRAAADRAAAERFNWEKERDVFLGCVRSVLDA